MHVLEDMMAQCSNELEQFLVRKAECANRTNGVLMMLETFVDSSDDLNSRNGNVVLTDG